MLSSSCMLQNTWLDKQERKNNSFFLLPLSELLLLTLLAYGAEYAFNQYQTDALAMSPPHHFPTLSLLAVGAGHSPDAVPAIGKILALYQHCPGYMGCCGERELHPRQTQDKWSVGLYDLCRSLPIDLFSLFYFLKDCGIDTARSTTVKRDEIYQVSPGLYKHCHLQSPILHLCQRFPADLTMQSMFLLSFLLVKVQPLSSNLSSGAQLCSGRGNAGLCLLNLAGDGQAWEDQQ